MAREGAGRWCAGRLAAREQQSSVPGIRVPARRGPVVPREARGKSASSYYEISLQGGETDDGKASSSICSVGAHRRPVLPGLSTVRGGVLTFMGSSPCIYK